MAEEGISSAVYYPLSLPAQEAFEGEGYREGSFVESERAAEEVLSLPMFPELTDEEVERVVRAVQNMMS